MPQITPVSFPIVGDATILQVSVLTFRTDDTTCALYYELLTNDNRRCLDGNYALTQEQYDLWAEDNTYLDNIVAEVLGLTIVTIPEDEQERSLDGN